MSINTNNANTALYDAYHLNVELMKAFTSSDTNDQNMTAYGFSVWRKNGYSLPKGMISSYVARIYPNDVSIEFSIQSPTGDASDFHHYTFPCVSKEQAITMVDYWHNMVIAQVDIENAKQYHKYLYS